MSIRTPPARAQLIVRRTAPTVKTIIALVASSPPAKTHRMRPMPNTAPDTRGNQGSPASRKGPAAVNMKTSARPMKAPPSMEETRKGRGRRASPVRVTA